MRAYVLVFCGAVVAGAFAQVAPDPSLLAEIEKIKAVDNHTHISKVVRDGETDRDFDALPCDIIASIRTRQMFALTQMFHELQGQVAGHSSFRSRVY